jgi:hypothetical protein
MTKKTSIALTLAAALFAALPGFADPTITLPSATSVTECTSVTGVVVDDPFSCSDGGGVAQATLSPFAGVSAQATAGANMSAGGFAALNYNFEVVGGTAGDVVPLLVTADLETKANSVSDAFASITVTTSLKTAEVFACMNEGPCTPGFSGTFGISAESGSGNTIHLEVVAGQVSSLGPENSSASADPLIVIDPSFANAANYSIVLSPGVANAVQSAVPEPNCVLLIGVFAGMGWATRRRDRIEAACLRDVTEPRPLGSATTKPVGTLP